MTEKEIELIDEKITDIRIKNLKKVDRNEIDKDLYDLQILVFKQED